MREMKDSGIEWIGAIPQDWLLSKIGSLYTQRNEKVSDKNYQPLSVTMQGILPQLATAAKTDDGDNRKLVRVGDFAINSRSDRRGSCGISPLDGSVSLINIILTPRTAMHPGYYNWLFNTTLFADEFYKWGHGIVADLWTTRWQEMKSITVPVPEYAEQERIAAFLDAECAEIDTVLEKTRASIEEYKKLKQAVITQAVTKGIRGDRPMKDSGIEWIGEISQDFEIVKLKWLCDVLDQFRSPVTADKRNQNADVLYDYYGASGAIDKIDGYTIDDHVMLIGEDGANLRMRNLPIMYEINGKAWVNNHAHILKPKAGVDFYFIFYALEALDLNYYITGSAQPKLSQDNLRNIWVPITDFTGQKRIAAYISDVCDEFDCLIAKKQQYLTEIENYKKSLIYEYVTGKKEVV